MNPAQPPDALSSAQLQGILAIADDAIVCFDAAQRVILFNHGAERIFGWQAHEVLGKPLDLLLPPRYRAGHADMVERFRQSGEVARRMAERRPIFAVRKSGDEFPAEASISQLVADDTIIYSVILRDISAQVERERELHAAKEAAEAAMQAKSLFLANMSHEIRTPLNAVIGMTSLLLNTTIDEEQRDYAETVRSSGEALLTIINDILDFSKIEVGRLEIERQPFDLRRSVEESLDLLSADAAGKNINLAYFIDDSVPAALVGDVTRLRQILVNLLSNAIKFTHRGEVTVNVSASARDDGRQEVSFAVRDTGIGIPADKLPLLFQSFSQVDASTTRKYGGTGLGLAISKRLAEMMGGRMWVDSSVGSGSTFHFTIVAEASGSSLATHFLREHSSALAGRRVLIVDDNSTNRRILVKQALVWGMLPSAAASAIEALDFVRHGHAFDVGILDMSMPEMDGMSLAQEIRKVRAADALPLVMLTSVAQRPADRGLSEALFAAYLNKPIKPSALLETMFHAMRLNPPELDEGQPPPSPGSLALSLPLDILVAEDNTVNQKVMHQLLGHLGYRADIVANGLEVLDALARQHYDIILMDVQMPELDGLETTRRLRQRFGDDAPRVIAMTASAMPGDRERCLAAGMDAYVSKPVELADVRAVLLQLAPPNRAVTAATQAAPLAADAADDPHATLPVIDMRRIAHLQELEDERNPNLVAGVIDMFCNDGQGHLDAIADAIRHHDAARMGYAAHRFLSGIENLGALRMREPAMALERLGYAGRCEGGEQQLALLVAAFAEAKARLAEIAVTF